MNSFTTIFRNVQKVMTIRDVLRDLVPLHNLKIVKNTHGGVLLLVKLQALARVELLLHTLFR